MRHEDGVADQVAAAESILLFIHGIIGDTEGMAKGLRLAADNRGANIDARLDLGLTYDYESFSASIDTARTLQGRLRTVGLHEHDQKRLTLLVHYMGGWLTAQEGGTA